jgi:outer membrane protein TolC
MESAASRIKVARADFFPAIRLNALIGLQSLGLGSLLQSDSTFGSVGPAVSLPVFHGGALAGRFRSANAGYDAAVADYDKTVLAAYQQVADAVTSRQALAARLGDTRAALAATQDAYTIARRRYDGGLSTYLDVLSVEDRLLQARLAATALEAAARSADITLIRALGGGFAPAAPEAAKDAPHD